MERLFKISCKNLLTAALIFCTISCRSRHGQCGGYIPLRPALNPFAITFHPQTCADLPLLDAHTIGRDGRDGHFARTMTEHKQGINADFDETVLVSVYFDNGGADLPKYVAKNVRATVVVAPEIGTEHRISAQLTADNAETVESAGKGGDIVVHTRKATKLAYVPNTAELCVNRRDAKERGAESEERCGTSGVAIHLTDKTAPYAVNLGNLLPGFVYSGTFDFRLRVEDPATRK